MVRELIINADKSVTLPARFSFGDTLVISMPTTTAGDYSDILFNKALKSWYVLGTIPNIGTFRWTYSSDGTTFQQAWTNLTTPNASTALQIKSYRSTLEEEICRQFTLQNLTTCNIDLSIQFRGTNNKSAGTISCTLPFYATREDGTTDAPLAYLSTQVRKSNNPVYGNTMYPVPGATDTFTLARPTWAIGSITAARIVITDTYPDGSSTTVHESVVTLTSTQIATLNAGTPVSIDYTYVSADSNPNSADAWIFIDFRKSDATADTRLATTRFVMDSFITMQGTIVAAGLGNAATLGATTKPANTFFGAEGNNINVYFTVDGYAPQLADGTNPVAGTYELKKSIDGGTTWTSMMSGSKSGRATFKYTYTTPTDDDVETTKIKLVCTDAQTGTVTESDVYTLATIKKIIMDVYQTGTGVAFGKIATRPGFDVDATMPIYVDGDMYIRGVKVSRVAIREWLQNQVSGDWTYDKITFTNNITIIQAYRTISVTSTAQTVYTPVDVDFTDPFTFSKLLVNTCGVDNASRTAYVGVLKWGTNSWGFRKYTKVAETGQYLIKLVKVGIM